MSDYEYPPLRQRVQSLIEQIKSTLLLPVRIATSKLAIRTYLTSLLFFLTSFFLLAIAIAAYTSFYWSYIPRIGFSRQIHLQYDHYPPPLLADPSANQQANPLTHPHPHPWGTVPLAPDFASQQLYDITVLLTLPRTPENTRQGNFMLNAHLLGPTPSPIPSPPGTNPLSNLLPGTASSNNNSPEILASSRRAAYLAYYSREIDLARKALRLPILLSGLSSETEDISILLFEGVSFPRGWRNIPSTLKLEVQSREGGIQIYECSVEFRARFRGLRWVMYNHRILAATVFVAAFWGFEVGAMGMAWLVLSLFIFPSSSSSGGGGGQKRIGGKDTGDRRRIKQEDDEFDHTEEDEQEGVGEGMSDTERTFPSYASQPLIRYQKSVKEEERGVDGKKIKREDDGDRDMEPFPPLMTQQMTGPEAADDEDDDEEGDDYVLDSGLGTSLESSAGGRREGGVRRRKSGRGRMAS